MNGTNIRILRVENGWRLILGDWQLDTDGAKPTEKVAVEVGELLAIVGAWAEESLPINPAQNERRQVHSMDQLRGQSQQQWLGDPEPVTSQRTGPIMPPVEESPEMADALTEPVDPPANEPHGFDAITGDPKQL